MMSRPSLRERVVHDRSASVLHRGSAFVQVGGSGAVELRQGRRKAGLLAEVCRSVVLQASTTFITRKIGKYESKNADRRTRLASSGK